MKYEKSIKKVNRLSDTDSVSVFKDGKQARIYKEDLLDDFQETVIPYKEYTALLAQSSTNAPTEVAVLVNTLEGTPVWSYSGSGVYILTLAGKFKENKTVIFLTTAGGTAVSAARNASDDSIFIGLSADDLLGDATYPGSITIKVYN